MPLTEFVWIELRWVEWNLIWRELQLLSNWILNWSWIELEVRLRVKMNVIWIGFDLGLPEHVQHWSQMVQPNLELLAPSSPGRLYRLHKLLLAVWSHPKLQKVLQKIAFGGLKPFQSAKSVAKKCPWRPPDLFSAWKNYLGGLKTRQIAKSSATIACGGLKSFQSTKSCCKKLPLAV